MASEHEGRGLGRVYAPDERDRQYPMRLRLDPLREQFFPRGVPAGARHYRPGKVLDQGSTGTCVGHGWTTKIESAPIMQPVGISPYDLYRNIVVVDEWHENDREAHWPDHALQFGTSVRAGAKVCQSRGLLSNYLWAESVEDVRAWHLAGFGGCVVGFNWTSDMFDTDSQGFIRYTGTMQGGHCVVTTGWNDRVRYNGKYVRALRFQNSWGSAWGQNGRAWILEDDLARLIADQGEVCAASELRVVPVAPTS